MTREDAARALAEAIPGWRYCRACPDSSWVGGHFHLRGAVMDQVFAIPVPSDGLPTHLFFLGRIAEALGKPWRLTFGDYTGAALPFQVGFSRADDENHIAWASDPSWAALLAALEAKGVSR